jgi:drug/metabolite transporter (DMT)-like permease
MNANTAVKILAPNRQQLWAGIACLVLGQWILSLLDASGKTLTQQGFHVVTVAWVRYVGHVVVLLILLRPKGFVDRLVPKAKKLQWMRGGLMLLSTLIFFSVLRLLPLAEATALNFCAPLFVVALSPWLLGERPSPVRWLGVLIGFAGMLVVVRPGSDLSTAGMLLGLLSAFVFGLLQLITRRIAEYDTPMTTLLQSGVIGTCLTTLLIPFFWFDAQPTPMQAMIFLSTGVTGSLGHYFVIRAFQYADASFLSPFLYLQIISATSIGYVAFGHLPDWMTAVGIAIICVGGMCVAGGETLLRTAMALVRRKS